MDKTQAHLVLNRIKDGDTTVSDEMVALALKVTGDLPNHEGVEDGKQKEHNPLVSWVYQTRQSWRVPEKDQS